MPTNRISGAICSLVLVVCLSASAVALPSFDFRRISQQMQAYTVVLDFTVEVSFGSQSSEAQQRVLGTIVDTSGLVIFDGTFLDSDFGGGVPGMTIKTVPTAIKATFLDDDQRMRADYLGTDRFTKLGFARLESSANRPLQPVRFVQQATFSVGSWFVTHLLLPEFVKPNVASDVGMLAAILESPEPFPLLVGFGPGEVGSVLFNERLQPIGVLGALADPSNSSSDPGGMVESFQSGDFPLLGIISASRINSLIADPPTKGKIDRAWLGITMQALTDDLADLLGVSAAGGVIVTDVISNSPAQKAGVAVGDIIYGIDGLPIPVNREELLPVFQKRIAELQPGRTVAFDLFRGAPPERTSLTLKAQLERAPISATDAEEYENDQLEIGFRDLVFSDYMVNNLDQQTFSGVVISKLKSGGLGLIAGLRTGDIVQRIGDQPLTNVADARQALESILATDPPEVVFFVWRDNRTLFVNVKTK